MTISKRASMHTLILIALLVLGKVTGFLKDLGITFSFGISETTDAFFIATYIASLLYIAVYASIPLVLVPLFTKANKTESDLKGYTQFVLLIYIILSSILATIVVSFSDYLISVFSSHPNPTVNLNASLYLKVMGLSFPISTIVACCNAKQSVRKFVLLAYSVPVVNNLFFIIGILIFNKVDSFIKVLWLGNAAWLLLALINLKNEQFSYKSIKYLNSSIKEWKSILILIFSAATILFMEQINVYVGFYFSGSLGDGVLSAYTYANKLNLLVLSTSLIIITTNIYPKLSSYLQKGELKTMAAFIKGGIKYVLLLTLPLAIYASIYNAEIVKLVFYRGEFDIDDTIFVSSIFKVLILTLPFSIIRDLIIRVHIANGSHSFILFSFVVVIVINIILCVLIVPIYGLLGVVFAQIVSLLVHIILLVYFLKLFKNQGIIKEVIIDTAQSFLYIFIGALFSLYLIHEFSLGLVIGFAVYFATHLFILWFFKEFREIKNFCLR
jgi:putative peptidoglycan lipid II flippase